MRTLAQLTEKKQDIAKELNHADVSGSRDTNIAEIQITQERQKLKEQIMSQEKEIATLKSEIMTLKRKDNAQIMPYMPVPPGLQSNKGSSAMFPPIPSATKLSAVGTNKVANSKSKASR